MAGAQQAILLSSAGGVLFKAFLAFDAVGPPGTTITFVGRPLGDAAANRRIIAVAFTDFTGATPTLSTATIGGIAAVIVVAGTGNLAATHRQHAAIILAEVPTGTTGNYVFNFSQTVQGTRIGIWSVIGMSTNTPTSTGYQGTAGSPNSVTLNTTLGSFVIGGCAFQDAGTMVLSGGVSTDADVGDAIYFSASNTAAGSLSPSFTINTGVSNSHGIIGASWPP